MAIVRLLQDAGPARALRAEVRIGDSLLLLFKTLIHPAQPTTKVLDQQRNVVLPFQPQELGIYPMQVETFAKTLR
ncbi:hypothetical protein ATY81_09025 [Rhizobium sp. R72]|nr:hypothetical protein ATY81_09025 [Rhizobium sp. R72]OWV97888.1 hypothetical protein ATY80_09025 [Rhizobium sp. R711]